MHLYCSKSCCEIDHQSWRDRYVIITRFSKTGALSRFLHNANIILPLSSKASEDSAPSMDRRNYGSYGGRGGGGYSQRGGRQWTRGGGQQQQPAAKVPDGTCGLLFTIDGTDDK